LEETWEEQNMFSIFLLILSAEWLVSKISLVKQLFELSWVTGLLLGCLEGLVFRDCFFPLSLEGEPSSELFFGLTEKVGFLEDPAFSNCIAVPSSPVKKEPNA